MRLGGYLRPAIAVLALAAALTITALHTGQAASVTGPTVLVSNSGAGQAVPVTFPNTPTVNIGNTPTVNLGAGTSVGISGPLQVSGPLAVKDQGTPFATTLCATVGGSCGNGTLSLTAGLIIEYTSTTCQLTGGSSGSAQFGGVALQVTTGGANVYHTITSIPTTIQVGTAGFITSAFAQQTRLYADPSSSIAAFATGGASNDGQVNCTVNISGRLLN